MGPVMDVRLHAMGLGGYGLTGRRCGPLPRRDEVDRGCVRNHDPLNVARCVPEPARTEDDVDADRLNVVNRNHS